MDRKVKRALLHRAVYLVCIALLCVLGIAVRRQSGVRPAFFNTYFPDAAWTMAVYCGFGLLFCKDARLHFPASLGVSFLVEVSQLWHAPFLDALRATTLGGLVLGYGFLWSDLVCYTVGACVYAGVQTLLTRYFHRAHHKGGF